jgi:hypothetical protein
MSHIIIEVPEGLTLKHEGFTLDVSTAGPATLAYLLQNGFSQGIGDAAATNAETLAELIGVTVETYKAKGFKPNAEQAAKIKEHKQGLMADKFEAIVAGTVGARIGGSRPKGLDWYIKVVAEQAVKAWSDKKGLEWPKGKGAAAQIAKLVEVWLGNEKKAAQVKAEAQRRMDADAAIATMAGSDDEG